MSKELGLCQVQGAAVCFLQRDEGLVLVSNLSDRAWNLYSTLCLATEETDFESPTVALILSFSLCDKIHDGKKCTGRTQLSWHAWLQTGWKL